MRFEQKGVNRDYLIRKVLSTLRSLEKNLVPKMYIEYITPQRVADPDITDYKSNGGKFRPTWLIRTSDWQKVRGHEVREGYHALSYCWEQSGEIIQKDHGEYDCLNKPHHRITKRVPDNKRRRLCFSKYRRRRDVEVTLEVTYDGVLQQVCEDFSIQYLWYDKICIDQTNKEEKKREIKQMHLIYSNACYTIALVPEIDVDDPLKFESVSWEMEYTEAKRVAVEQMLGSLWWRRSWTLEEVMMSTRIVIVGKNTHFWSLARDKQGNTTKENDFLCVQMLGFKDKKWKSANQVLTDAHFRTSSKEHDKIFALANILHDIISIDIDYTSDLTVTINSFYRQLIEHDMSVMCFGSALLNNGEPQYLTTMDSYGIPSWTGVSGLHASRPIAEVVRDQNSSFSVGDDMRLYIKCRSYTIKPIKYDDKGIYTDHQRESQAQDYYMQNVITCMGDFGDNMQAALDYSQNSMYQGTSCLATHYWKPDHATASCSPILPLSLTEDCDECTILAILFDSVTAVFTENDDNNWTVAGYTHDYFLPVLKKSIDGLTHRVIGVILLKHFLEDEARKSPKEFLTDMFGILGGNLHDFVVK